MRVLFVCGSSGGFRNWVNLPVALSSGGGGKEARSSLSLTKELLAGS